jgi:hypothetical protein
MKKCYSCWLGMSRWFLTPCFDGSTTGPSAGYTRVYVPWRTYGGEKWRKMFPIFIYGS